MMSDIKTPNGKERVRLNGKLRYTSEHKSKTPEARQRASENRKKSVKKAPKNSKGKIIQGHKYKSIIDSYKDLGLKPKIKSARTKTSQSKPLFVRNPVLARRIIKFIRAGYHPTTVCRAVGIATSTFRKWLELGAEGKYPVYTKFYKRIANADAKAEMQTLKKLKKHQRTDWRAAAWDLERRWSENWGKDVVKSGGVSVNATITVNRREEITKVISQDEHAKELARRVIDGGEFGFKEITNEKNDT